MYNAYKHIQHIQHSWKDSRRSKELYSHHIPYNNHQSLPSLPTPPHFPLDLVQITPLASPQINMPASTSTTGLYTPMIKPTISIRIPQAPSSTSPHKSSTNQHPKSHRSWWFRSRAANVVRKSWEIETSSCSSSRTVSTSTSASNSTLSLTRTPRPLDQDFVEIKKQRRAASVPLAEDTRSPSISRTSSNASVSSTRCIRSMSLAPTESGASTVRGMVGLNEAMGRKCVEREQEKLKRVREMEGLMALGGACTW